MPEIRLNPITGDWVIIATERAKRPEDFCHTKERKELPPWSASCPFCLGNEDKTPLETFRLTGDDGKWTVRAVPNRFSALSSDGDVIKQKADFKQYITGVGLHEVIIESPIHNTTTALLPLGEVQQILNAYRDRILSFYEDPRIQHVIIFKNHGEGAGTSLEHPHSQIVGTPVIPGQVIRRLDEAIRHYYYEDFGDCLYCSYMASELKDGIRILRENNSFVAFVPYAAITPFQVWIFPRRHSASFGMIKDTELIDLAAILKEILLRIYIGMDNPDFNYMLRSLSPREADAKFFHWYMTVVPRVSQIAGFELGTGMSINTALPEESAKFLREVKIPAF